MRHLISVVDSMREAPNTWKLIGKEDQRGTVRFATDLYNEPGACTHGVTACELLKQQFKDPSLCLHSTSLPQFVDSANTSNHYSTGKLSRAFNKIKQDVGEKLEGLSSVLRKLS